MEQNYCGTYGKKGNVLQCLEMRVKYVNQYF
jgi:hypothetical protein